MSYIIFVFKLNQEKTMKLIKKINILTIISIIGMHAVFAHAHTKEETVIEMMPTLLENEEKHDSVIIAPSSKIDENSDSIQEKILAAYGSTILDTLLKKTLKTCDPVIKVHPVSIHNIQNHLENSILYSRSQISQEETQIIDRLMGNIDHILHSSNTILEKKSKILEQLKSEEIISLGAHAKRKMVNLMTYISKTLEHEMFHEAFDYVISMIAYYLGIEYSSKHTDLFH